MPILSDEVSPAQHPAAPPRAGGHAVLQEGRRGPGPTGIQMGGGGRLSGQASGDIGFVLHGGCKVLCSYLYCVL